MSSARPCELMLVLFESIWKIYSLVVCASVLCLIKSSCIMCCFQCFFLSCCNVADILQRSIIMFHSNACVVTFWHLRVVSDGKPMMSTPSAIPVPYNYGQGTSKKIDIPNGRVGVIIGKAGETIKYLQLQSGAKIQVTRDMDADPNSPTRPVELMGTPEQIAKAEQLINDVLAEVGPCLVYHLLVISCYWNCA